MGEFQLGTDDRKGLKASRAPLPRGLSGLSREERVAQEELLLAGETIGARIKRRREALGQVRGRKFSQGELAKMIGVTPGAVSQWESDMTRPAHDLHDRLAQALDCPTEWLVSGSGDPPPNMPGPRQMVARASANVIVRGTEPSEHGDLTFTGHVVGNVRRPAGLERRESYAFYMRGSAMAPLWEEGDTIFVDLTRPPQLGDYVVIELKAPKEGGRNPILIRRLIFREDGKIEVVKASDKKREHIPNSNIVAMHRIMRLNELLSL